MAEKKTKLPPAFQAREALLRHVKDPQLGIEMPDGRKAFWRGVYLWEDHGGSFISGQLGHGSDNHRANEMAASIAAAVWMGALPRYNRILFKCNCTPISSQRKMKPKREEVDASS